MKISKKWLVLPLVLISAFVSAQNVDEILAKYFENTGGINNWRGLKAIKVTGKTPTPQGEFPFTVWRKAPNLTKMVINVQGQEIVAQAYDGKNAWMLNPFAGGTTATKLDEEQAKQIAEEEFEDAFIDYKNKGHEVTLNGEEEIDGVKCFKVTLIKNKNNDKDDVTIVYYFDTENFVPIMRKEYIRSGPAKGTEVEVYLSDYQEVGAFMLPHFVEQKVDGRSVIKMISEKIELNPQMEDSIFAFPGGN